MNICIFTGNICFNPEIIDKGCKIKLAVYNGKNIEALFLKVFIFGDCAQKVLVYKKKGDKICIQGRLTISKNNEIIVVSDNVEFS